LTLWSVTPYFMCRIAIAFICISESKLLRKSSWDRPARMPLQSA